ncbi:MAG TPA: DUF3617 family protein [Thiobacillus sp.]
MRRLPITVLFAVALPFTAHAAPAIQPGLYDISMQMVLKGMPMQMPVSTFRQCITEQDVANGKAYATNENKGCTISNLNQGGDKVSYDFSCATPGGPRMVGRASGRTHASGYDIFMSGRFDPAIEGMSEFSQKLNAKRLGPCQ